SRRPSLRARDAPRLGTHAHDDLRAGSDRRANGERDRNEHVWYYSDIGAGEPRRRHADHGEWQTVQEERAAERAWVGIVLTLPEPVPQHDRRRALPLIGLAQRST